VGERESMPGVVIMNDMVPNGAERAKDVQNGEPTAAVSSAEVKPLLNGSSLVAQMDGLVETNISQLTNGIVASPPGTVDVPKSFAELPPEIQHISTGFQPMSKLIQRVVQECYNGLVEVINEMADESTAEKPFPSPVNGIHHGFGINGASAGDAADVAKRLRMMEYANRHRERFIKLLVLLQWSRQVDDVSKMIDLYNWHNTQMGFYDDAAEWIGQLRLSMSSAKLPNPDIKTALTVLSTGKASWISDVRKLLLTMMFRD
jgi:mediator of RNA polymerase II transcription subunit 14